jgi:HAMP domain-containing protein
MRGHTPGAPGTDEDVKAANVYLKRRNAQLQDDVTSLQAEVNRLTQQLERVMHARSARADHDRA